MVNKKVMSLFVMLVVAGVTFSILYFKYWREPAAKYIETDNPQLIQIRKDLDELKGELKAKGIYNCCISNDCSWCALYMGHCPCAELVSREGVEKSCPECAAAWNRKQGKIPGVDPDAVQVTTFGIYGYEKESYHHSDFTGEEAESTDTPHHEREGHQH